MNRMVMSSVAIAAAAIVASGCEGLAGPSPYDGPSVEDLARNRPLDEGAPVVVVAGESREDEDGGREPEGWEVPVILSRDGGDVGIPVGTLATVLDDNHPAWGWGRAVLIRIDSGEFEGKRGEIARHCLAEDDTR